MTAQTTMFAADRYAGVKRSAEISECGRYRWWLRRSWPKQGNGKTVCFLMLNPSKADGLKDDPTLRRCMGFALDWGFTTLSVRNLFPFRTAYPSELKAAGQEVACGGVRGCAELMAAFTADMVIAAWGADVPFDRDKTLFDTLRLLPPVKMHVLGFTKKGMPRHALYVGKDVEPVAWEFDS